VNPVEAELQGLRDRLLDWLMRSALPLWWTAGADHENGGFHEALDAAGRPVMADRRARVQARQSFSYAVGGELGWDGPWREAVAHGLTYFIGRYRRPDGLFWNRVSADGTPIEEQPHLYEQAFALLALATAKSAGVEPVPLAPIAEAILDRLLAERRNPAGGFTGFADNRLYQSDPHMHLFEAALAWEQVAPEGRWGALADEVAELCLTRFMALGGGPLLEYFEPDWTPAAGQAGHLVWPGHQFEWAGLLERWALARGREDVRPIARRLFAIGAAHGIDPVQGVAMFELLDDLSVNNPKARLWSQTEWLKAALILARRQLAGPERDLYLANAVAGAKALWGYLETPLAGLWRDWRLADGTFEDAPAPASSFYHIIDALRVLAAWRASD
jgi:mannose-6-phosphate isomerase